VPASAPPSPSPLGRRVIVTGATCSGKSTLARQLAALTGGAYVEMDALFWKPGWTGSSDGELFEKLAAATRGDAWVVAGNYTRTRHLTWPRAQTIVWLDLPLRTVVWRVLARSWRRWGRNELLWGTNRERFWTQLAIWRKEDSLLWWAFHTHGAFRERFLSDVTDPQWAHLRFIRLRSAEEVEAFVASLERSAAGALETLAAE
jgi:adenylate kinase family enzyme